MVTGFLTPEASLAGLDAEATALVIATAADIALVLDASGVVVDIAFGAGPIAQEGFQDWVGRPWVDCVTSDGRDKIEAMLSEIAAPSQGPLWRQVNHPAGRSRRQRAAAGSVEEAVAPAETIPVAYVAIALGVEGRVVALGRDLRDVAAMQQRLVDAQRAMDRDYSRLRQAETRYRLLFQLASEAVIIVNDVTGKIVEANPAALALASASGKKLAGRAFIDLIDGEARAAMNGMLASVRALGEAEAVTVALRSGPARVSVSASLFRQEAGAFFLVRLRPADRPVEDAKTASRAAAFQSVVDAAPEAFVLTDLSGHVLMANAAFLELVELTSEEQARGVSLDRWLGRHGVDLSVILGGLKEHGALRFFATVMRGAQGGVAEVELSAVAAPHGDLPCLGLMIRNVEARASAAAPTPALPKSVEQLTELVGRVPLKDIVRETTDVIERLCIEAALELTGDNRASAAEMLGLSRQSLYVKLRRYGLGDLDSGEA